MTDNRVLDDDDQGNLVGLNGGKMVNQWTIEEVANWLNSCGFQDCVQVFQAHAISGPVVPRLTPDLLREMGVQSVGRRVELQAAIVSVQAKARSQWRNEVLWAEEQYREGPCNGALPFGFPWCCLCCTGLPEVYKVTNSKLNISRSVNNCTIGGCCGKKMRSENSDLTDVKDVSVSAQTTLIGDPAGRVAVFMTNSQPVTLHLKSSQCVKVTAIITNAKEEAVIQEGLQKFGRA